MMSVTSQMTINNKDEGLLPERTLLLDAQLGLTSWLGKDSPLCNENNMLAREFLLKFTNKTRLDLLEGSQLGHGYKDDDSFLATNVNFLCSCNVKFTKLSFQVGVQLQIKESMSDRVLELVGLLAGWLDDFRSRQHDLGK